MIGIKEGNSDGHSFGYWYLGWLFKRDGLEDIF